MAGRKRVLFFAEAVTLAHVARPLALADRLDRERYETIVACSPRYRSVVDGAKRSSIVPLDSIGSEQFLASLAAGRPVYDAATLRRYVRQDLEIIRSVAPDLVVGDFRLSLSVSCRLAGLPYGAVTNAYWSPWRTDTRYPLPVLPMTAWMPLPAARAVFRAASPLAFGLHCRPLNQVRREHGLTSLGSDLRRVYTDADYTLYADAPDFFDLAPLPASHRYLGPVLWSPDVARPAWWDSLPASRPIVYATLGSSGQSRVLERVIDSLARLPVTGIVSTAGASPSRPPAANLHVAPYLPGIEAAARADLVICNGGSPTSQQALAAGVPVLGIAGNLDQFLNMDGVVRSGAGLLLRADRASVAAIGRAVETLLHMPVFKARATAVASRFERATAEPHFQRWVDEVTGRSTVSGTGRRDTG